MSECIRTLNYGLLPIAYSSRWLDDDIIDIIEEANSDNYYEVRKTLNGALVALLSKEE